MHRRALAVIVIVGIVVAVMVLVARRRQESPLPESGTRSALPGTTGTEEVARLRKEVEELRKEVERKERRAAKAEEELARLKSEDSPGHAEPKAPTKAADWRTRREGKFAEKVKATDWRKHVKVLMEYWQEIEKARAEGGSPSMTPDLIAGLTKMQQEIGELAKELGLTGVDVWKVYDNRLVEESWMDSILQEVTGGNLTESQLAKLRVTTLYADDGEFDRENGNVLEAWKELVEHNRAYSAETAGILTADQHAMLTQAVTPTFMMSVYAQYSEKPLAGAAGVTTYWMDKFKLPAAQQTTVETIAADFVQKQAALAQLYGSSPTRDAQFELLVKTIEIQIAAEKQLAQSLNLDPELAKKLLRGSGSVIKVTK